MFEHAFVFGVKLGVLVSTNIKSAILSSSIEPILFKPKASAPLTVARENVWLAGTYRNTNIIIN